MPCKHRANDRLVHPKNVTVVLTVLPAR